jgi:hypothetical protein
MTNRERDVYCAIFDTLNNYNEIVGHFSKNLRNNGDWRTYLMLTHKLNILCLITFVVWFTRFFRIRLIMENIVNFVVEQSKY